MVITTVLCALQPFPSVTITVKVVVVTTVATGFGAVESLNPAPGLQWYLYGVVPPDAVGVPPKVTVALWQKLALLPALATKLGLLTVTVTCDGIDEHPKLSVTTNV
jgi:hypothetical protein